MCLRISGDSRPSPKVATKDLYVYKFLYVVGSGPNAYLRSPYRSSRYNPGRTYTTKMMPEKRYFSSIWRIERGLHSFATFRSAKAVSDSWYGRDIYIFVCVIPEGATYYTGTFNGRKSYASDKLIVLRRDDPRSMKLIRNLPPRN